MGLGLRLTILCSLYPKPGTTREPMPMLRDFSQLADKNKYLYAQNTGVNTSIRLTEQYQPTQGNYSRSGQWGGWQCCCVLVSSTGVEEECNGGFSPPPLCSFLSPEFSLMFFHLQCCLILILGLRWWRWRGRTAMALLWRLCSNLQRGVVPYRRGDHRHCEGQKSSS